MSRRLTVPRNTSIKWFEMSGVCQDATCRIEFHFAMPLVRDWIFKSNTPYDSKTKKLALR